MKLFVALIFVLGSMAQAQVSSDDSEIDRRPCSALGNAENVKRKVCAAIRASVFSAFNAQSIAYDPASFDCQLADASHSGVFFPKDIKDALILSYKLSVRDSSGLLVTPVLETDIGANYLNYSMTRYIRAFAVKSANKCVIRVDGYVNSDMWMSRSVTPSFPGARRMTGPWVATGPALGALEIDNLPL